MHIEKIANSLLSDAKKEADEIVAIAESHVEKMLAEERAKKHALLKNAGQETNSLIEEQKRERIPWARLEAKRIISEAREDVIKRSLDEFFTVIETILDQQEYTNFIKTNIKEAISELKNNKDLVIHCSKNEKKNFDAFNLPVIEDLKSIGGAIVETADGRVRIDLTMETLFEIKLEGLRKIIYERLFDDITKRQENEGVKKEEIADTGSKKQIKRRK